MKRYLEALFFRVMVATACVATVPFSSVSALAGDRVRMDKLHVAVNAAAKRSDMEARLTFSECGDLDGLYGCVYSWTSPGKIIARGDGRTGTLEQVAAYLPPERRSGVDVSVLAMAFMRTLSPQLGKRAIGAALMRLVTDAAGPSRRGAVTIQGITYVLRANDGTDVRLYITLDD